MNNRVPMRRTGFKRKVSAWASAPRAERVYRTPTLADPAAFRAPQPITTSCAAVLKEAPVRSEAYRRAVASLPRAICGVDGYSQAAHGNTGKGMAIKSCDLTCFPACATRPGVVGCHARLDQGAMFTKEERRQLEPVWAAATQARVLALGLWPKKLPVPDASQQTNAMKKGVNEYVQQQ